MEESRLLVRKIESDLSSNLSTYSKLINITSLEKNKDVSNIVALEAEIEEVLAKFNIALNNMSELIVSSNNISTIDSHTLQRYRSILNENKIDFKKMKILFNTNKNRLLIVDGKDTTPVQRSRTDMLLKEKSSIESSIRKADESLDQATAVRQSLLNQRDIFNRVGNNVSTLLAKFPVLNNLLGLVISTCIILILLYIFN